MRKCIFLWLFIIFSFTFSPAFAQTTGGGPGKTKPVFGPLGSPDMEPDPSEVRYEMKTAYGKFDQEIEMMMRPIEINLIFCLDNKEKNSIDTLLKLEKSLKESVGSKEDLQAKIQSNLNCGTCNEAKEDFALLIKARCVFNITQREKFISLFEDPKLPTYLEVKHNLALGEGEKTVEYFKTFFQYLGK
ncbi:MAG: hypothetical protein ACOYL6_14755 [Bacteriovoracaceae bacterium]